MRNHNIPCPPVYSKPTEMSPGMLSVPYTCPGPQDSTPLKTVDSYIGDTASAILTQALKILVLLFGKYTLSFIQNIVKWEKAFAELLTSLFSVGQIGG